MSTFIHNTKAYRKVVILKAIIVHGWLLGVEVVVQGEVYSLGGREGVLLVEEKVYTFGKGDLSSGVHGCDFGCTKSRLKENLKRVAWGLDVGHKDRTRIILFAFVYSLRFIFLFANLFICLMLILLVLVLCCLGYF